MKHKRFNQLSKNEIFTIAMLLDLPEILALCRTAKKFNIYMYVKINSFGLRD